MTHRPARAAALAALAQALIPPRGPRPGGGDVLAAPAAVARLLAARPDLEPVLATVLDGFEGDAAGYLDHLERTDAPRFGAFLQAVLGAYFLDAPP